MPRGARLHYRPVAALNKRLCYKGEIFVDIKNFAPTPGAGQAATIDVPKRRHSGRASKSCPTPGDGIPVGSAREYTPVTSAPTHAECRSLNTDLMFSSRTDEWATPQEFFDELDREFHFELDACALPSNAKCERFYTPEEDGLKQPWVYASSVFCNPPYGRTIGRWVRKAAEAAAAGCTVVMLLPARTDTRWFHDYIYLKPGVKLRFVRGRLKFGDGKNSAPFPSMVVIFGGDARDVQNDQGGSQHE